MTVNQTENEKRCRRRLPTSYATVYPVAKRLSQVPTVNKA